MKCKVNQKGFTLLEVIIAMIIFSFVLMSICTFLVSYTRVNASMKRLTQATQLANMRIEQLRTVPYASLPAVCAVRETINVNIGKNSIPFERICTDIDNATWHKVDVKVKWLFLRRSHEVNLSTIIAQ